jgi:hypothetical protein
MNNNLTLRFVVSPCQDNSGMLVMIIENNENGNENKSNEDMMSINYDKNTYKHIVEQLRKSGQKIEDQYVKHVGYIACCSGEKRIDVISWDMNTPYDKNDETDEGNKVLKYFDLKEYVICDTGCAFGCMRQPEFEQYLNDDRFRNDLNIGWYRGYNMVYHWDTPKLDELKKSLEYLINKHEAFDLEDIVSYLDDDDKSDENETSDINE